MGQLFRLDLEGEEYIRVSSGYGAPPDIEIFTKDIDSDMTAVYLPLAQAAELGRALLDAAGVAPERGSSPLAVIDRRFAEEHTKLREARRAKEQAETDIWAAEQALLELDASAELVL